MIVSFLLMVSLGAWILSVATARTIGHAEQAKTLLHESRIYEAVIPSQIAEAQKNNPTLANIPLQNSQVQKLLATSVDSQQLQAQGDEAVDGIYNWLEGKSDKPKLSIDVTANAQTLSTSLSDLAATHAASLRPCVPGQDDYSTFSSDPISANCLPPGVTPDVVRSYVTQAVQNNPALAATTQLTEEDVKLTNGKTIMESFDAAPVWYQRAQLIPLVSAVAAIVLMLLLLLILKPLRGVRSIGKHLLSVGITLAIVAFALAWGIEKLYSTFIPKNDNPNIGDALMQLTTAFNASLRDNIITLSAGTAIVGLVLFVFAVIVGRFSHHATASTNRAPVRMPEPVSLAKGPAAVSFTPIVSRVADKVKGAPALPSSKSATAKRKPAAKKKTTRKKSK
jgi:hypothetical protein